METDVQNHLIIGDDLLIKNMKSFRFVQAFCAPDDETRRQGFAHPFCHSLILLQLSLTLAWSKAGQKRFEIALTVKPDRR